MKKIYLSGNYVTVIYDGTNERLYPISQVQLSEFTDHFLIENRIENQPKDTQVSFAGVGSWFNEAGDTAYTVESLRTFFTGISSTPGDVSQSELTEVENIAKAGQSGYSHSGAFADKPTDNNFVWQAGAGVSYSQADVDAGLWKVFSLSEAVHLAVDNPYWSTPTPSGNTGIGLFQGANLPNDVSKLFEFDFDYDANYPSSSGTGFEGTTGRIRLNDAVYGDQLRVRFDFNVIPQIANTTVEPALWYSNRNDNDDITFTFPLTAQPIFYGQGTVGRSFLNRVDISAWITSNEDVNALTLPAIKSDNPVIIQPLGLLVTLIR